MKKFNEFGIKPAAQSFTGDKIKMDRILNKEIVVHDYKIENSKFEEKGSKKCLYMQIELNSEKRVVFTGATVLMELIQQIKKEDFPFVTTIKKESERLEFT